uniref:Cytochrome c oxidase subunit 2 n=1 Tax=Sophonia fuscomarginata TaxID=3092774 RepID=A0AAF1C2E2_9HEMI|nr:cytochrome c oxidase subunit II [Sophonia fuscomarginata]WPC85262.1 cytochrome c oxidase subunit II [Sophonia fuscomarginata]
MKWLNLSYQDSLTPNMEELIMLNDHALVVLIFITIIVSYMIFFMLMNNLTNRFLLEGQMIELLWTLLPAVMLIFIALPSLRILYMLEEINNPLITIKAIGHQWYWSYEYSDFKKIEFDSYMKPVSDLESNEMRLLDSDNMLVLPFNIKSRILMTSSDVIHSWTIPSLGLKVDASPGRLNQGCVNLLRPGIFFGQCSEICGLNHSFMPIMLYSINMSQFLNWLNNY